MELLGGDRRLEATLRQVGRSGTAAVSHAAWTPTVPSGRQAHGQARTATWRLRLQVEPDGEAPFDTTLTEVLPLGEEISIGERITVLFDPDDHRRVAIDHTGHDGSGTVGVGPGSPVTFTPRPTLASGSRSSGPGEWTPAPQGMLAHPSAGGSRLADVSRPNEGGSGATPEDRVARLAELRDHGALTSAEFERQKRQILGR